MSFSFIKKEYIGLKKFKTLNFLLFKLKFRVNNKSKIREFLNENKPKPISSLEHKHSGKKVYLSIVAIYKNEPDIIEWIEYHKLAGVERFYLYDNASTDDSKKLLQPYINSGEVVYHYVEGKCMQLPVYRDAVYTYKDETQWLAIIDLDEYICPVEKNDIKDVLKEYEKYPALGVNWVLFDSNGLKNRPDNLVIDAYTRVPANYQFYDNRHIKSIVNPRKVQSIVNPHFCFYKKRELCVDENYNQIGSNILFLDTNANARTKKNSINKIRINHYHSKSEEDYVKKRSLGFADKEGERPKDSHTNFEVETANDYVIQKYLPELKKVMSIKEYI